MSFIRFLSYHNAIPVGFSLLVLSFGSAFAASEEVRDSVFSQEQIVVSVDNTYIATKDLSQYTPRVSIVQVTEDESSYYVSYDLMTIDLTDYVWQDVTKKSQMRVDKALLGNSVDLGVYVTEQLAQIIDHEIVYLREVQEIEKRQVSQKAIATEYGGLVGKFLDNTTEVLPGYTPVIVAPVALDTTQVASAAASTQTQGQTGSVSSGDSNDSEPPTIQILGNTPARVPLGASYADLGVAVTDNRDLNPRVTVFVDGKEVSYVSLDTASVKDWVIRYEVTDQAGNMAYIERIVEVFDPNPRIEPADNAAGTSTESTEVTETEIPVNEASALATSTPEATPLVVPENTEAATTQGTSTPE